METHTGWHQSGGQRTGCKTQWHQGAWGAHTSALTLYGQRDSRAAHQMVALEIWTHALRAYAATPQWASQNERGNSLLEEPLRWRQKSACNEDTQGCRRGSGTGRMCWRWRPWASQDVVLGVGDWGCEVAPCFYPMTECKHQYYS